MTSQFSIHVHRRRESKPLIHAYSYLLVIMDNNLIDTSSQKGFLTGINGTKEHIFAVTAMIQNAIHHGLPIAITFLDLANAFGSISHQLIQDIIIHCRLPSKIIAYISSL